MENSRPLRQARQAEALAEKAANELLLEECRKEVKKQKKKYIGVAFMKKSETASDRVRIPFASHVPYPAAIANESNDAMESEEEEIVDDGCSTTLYGKNSFKILSKQYDSEEEEPIVDRWYQFLLSLKGLRRSKLYEGRSFRIW